jgi:arylsulfatase A-like enzyme
VGGVTVPENIQGKSLLPLMEGKKTEWRESVYYHYYEYPDEHRVMPHFGIRTNRYKLIRFYGDGDFWELYDLSNDPGEMKNIYPEKKFDKLARALKEDLKKLINEYDDQEALEKMMDGK